MLFDTWAGLLYLADTARSPCRTSARLSSDVQALPRPRRSRGAADLLRRQRGGWIDRCRDIGADVIGLDWRLDLDRARRSLAGLALQGNLDPAVLLGIARADSRARGGRARRAGPAGHVFNLGHGILPETAPDHARFLVDTVRELSARSAS